MCSRYTYNKNQAKLKLRDQILVFGCVPRGAAVYSPLKPLLALIGGSYVADAQTVRVAYPPGVAVATRVVPTPVRTPTVASTPLVPRTPEYTRESRDAISCSSWPSVRLAT